MSRRYQVDGVTLDSPCDSCEDSCVARIIPPEYQTFAADAVASGKYRSEEELVFTALRLLEHNERRLDALRSDLQIGLSELDRWEGIVLGDAAAQQAFFDDIKARGCHSRGGNGMNALLRRRNKPKILDRQQA